MRPTVRPRLVAASVVAISAAVPSSRAGVEEPVPPRPHPVVLWTFDDDAARPGFADAVRSVGANAVQCGADRDPAPFRRAGLGWYEDDAAVKGTIALREKVAKPAWERFWAARTDAWPAEDARRRPRCLFDPAVEKEMQDGVERAAKRAVSGDGPRALWISLADEPGNGVRADPTDWCLCDACVKRFRADVKTRESLDDLNRRWGTTYRSWDAVRPWTTAEIRTRVLAKPPAQWNLAPWMETRAFQDASFAARIDLLTRKSAAPARDVPAGLSGVQAPSAFGGFDLFGGIVAGRTYAEPYDIGLALPICRDAAPGAVLAQTVFPDGADARVSRWRLWRGVSRGSNATIVWSSHDALRWDDATKSYAPTEYGRALSSDLARLTAPGGLGERLASTFAFDEEIAIVVSQPSIRVRWMLDSVEDGATWPRRFGSYEATHSTAIRSREAAWRALAQRGARFRPARPLDTSKLGLPTRVVVLPDAIALDDATTESLAAAARAGVLVVADVEPAQFDEFGRARAPGSGGVAGSVVDPGFATLAARVEKAIGPPLLRATATRADGGPAPPIEIGLRRAADGTTFAVCLAVWDVTTGADGAAQGRVPATELTVEFTFGDGAPHPVRDEWASNDLGPVRTWTARTDAALPLVWSWPAR